MAINQSSFAEYAARAPVRKSAVIVEEARSSRKQTAFLSHSHQDAHLAKGVQGFLQAQGWEVYIDWEDLSMPPSPTRETAEKIQKRIRELDWFLFLATANSVTSRWCPWEIGYADGVKKYDSILVIPTRDRAGATHGSEYLQLYRHVDLTDTGAVGAFMPHARGNLLREMRVP